MTKAIYFDMDGTIANLYGVQGWLEALRSENESPYIEAEPMLNFSLLARLLNRVQAKGWKLGIISWTSKGGSEEYNIRVAEAKKSWLALHLPSVHWDSITIVPYGTNKWETCGDGILFDDDELNHEAWQDECYFPDMIIDTLLHILHSQGGEFHF